MKILVTGAKGQLGHEFQALAKKSAHRFIFCDREEMDLADESSILRYLEKVDFDVIINCGAYTNVDGAEDDETTAMAINGHAPGVLAKYCAEKSRRLIHISTDYVFDGSANEPLTEESTPNPVSAYGRSKLAGETNVLNYMPEAYIIRTSWVYSVYGHNFLKTMMRLGKERDHLTVVYDQIGTPTHAKDLASAILSILDQWTAKDQPGIYHFSNQGVASWYDFAQAIFEEAGLACKVAPVRSSAFPTKAKRPGYSVLAKEKIVEAFEITIPYWRESLRECIAQLEV